IEVSDAARASLSESGVRCWAALAAVQRDSYDAVLMDMYMPEMDGLEATRAIRALGGSFVGLPIIGLTGAVTAEELDSCRAAGMNDVAAKPIDLPQLLGMLARWTASPDAEAGILDLEPVRMLAEELGEEVLEELIGVFQRSGESLCQRLVAGRAGADADAVEKAAHEFKGAAAGLGLSALSELCLQAEMAAKEGRIDEAALAAVQDHFALGLAALSRAASSGALR
ncbi:MAG: response regulator, partial [Rhodospirillales bacterium]|nr:response regulator [Rhodospirillales bacterium]